MNLTFIKPSTIEYSCKLIDSVYKKNLYNIDASLTVNSAVYTATSDYSGLLKFTGTEVVEGRDAVLTVKNNKFKDLISNIKISKNVDTIENIPLLPIKLTFTDQNGAPLKEV